MDSRLNSPFIEEPEFYSPSDIIEVDKICGYGRELYSVERGHHLNWVRKYLKINDPDLIKKLAIASLNKDSKNLPEEFYQKFPQFVRILICNRKDEASAYFETYEEGGNLRKVVSQVLRLYKNISRVEICYQNDHSLTDYSRMDYIRSVPKAKSAVG